MCFPFYPQDSEVNKEGEWKVVFALTYKMIIGQKTNCKFVVCGGWETGSGPDETRKSDVGQLILPSPSSKYKVKFFVYCYVWKMSMNMEPQCKKM
jgi:hypothetical protein